MAKRRTVKLSIHYVCMELWAECVAVSLYTTAPNPKDVETLLHSIIKLENDYISRVSHVEPGMRAKDYFKNLGDKFNANASEIADQVNNLI